MHRSRLSLASIVGLLFTATAVAEDYKIKLDRPEKAGSRYRLNATFSKTEKMTVTANGMVVQNRDRNVNAVLEAVVQNLKVDDKGNVLKKRVTIEKFTDDKGNELLKKGQVVVAETVDKKTKHQLADGGTLEPKALAAVKEIVKTHTGKPSDDESFGTNKRQKVGDSWKIKSGFAAKELEIPADAIQGTVKLEKVETVGGRKCLRLTTRSTVTAFPKAASLKKMGIDVKSIDFKITMSGLFPVDLTQQPVSRSAKMTMKADLDGPNGVKLKMSMQFSGKRTRTPLK